MAYKMITTAERGWYFVQTDQAQISLPGPIVSRIAAWALTEDDKVVGLIGLSIHEHRQTLLHEPPVAVNGTYKHYNDLTKAELAYLGSNPNCPNRSNF